MPIMDGKESSRQILNLIRNEKPPKQHELAADHIDSIEMSSEHNSISISS